LNAKHYFCDSIGLKDKTFKTLNSAATYTCMFVFEISKDRHYYE